MNSITLASSCSLRQLAGTLLDTHGPALIDHMLIEQQGRDSASIPDWSEGDALANAGKVRARLDALLGHVNVARGNGAGVRQGGTAETKALARASCARQRIAHLLG